MLIVDAIRRSNSVHEVCLLLTNYVETLQFYDTSKRLPAGVAVLPVRGREDIEARYANLKEAKARTSVSAYNNSSEAIVEEAIEVFYEALCSLTDLTGSEHAGAQSAVSGRPAANARRVQRNNT